MRKYETPIICSVTTTDYDKQLLKEVVEIERLVQPYDHWNEQTITDLLSQQHNKCWVVLNPHLTNKNISEAIAYCIFSSVFEVAEILRIGTHPDYQRQGLASGLIQALIKSMDNKNLDRILLEVRADNEAAIALYQNIGFAVIHRRENYYSIKNDTGNTICDALIMQFDKVA